MGLARTQRAETPPMVSAPSRAPARENPFSRDTLKVSDASIPVTEPNIPPRAVAQKAAIPAPRAMEPATPARSIKATAPRMHTARLAHGGSPSRAVRAKVTEGVPMRSRVGTTSSSHQECDTPTSRVYRQVRPLDRPAQAPIPRPPTAERIDVASLESEVGDGSFVLEPDDLHGPDSVQVHVRLRPTMGDEECAWKTDEESATLMLDDHLAATKGPAHVGVPYQFDGLHTGSSNADIYASLARPLVHSVLHGYHGVIFAYGQTASGKTFTLSGDEAGLEPGVIPRAVQDLFQGICQGSAQREYLLRVSYLEIWNEVVKDLLEPSNQPQVRDDRRRGAHAVSVAPLHEAVVTSPAQVFKLLARGEAHRHMGETDWNERSSRSHTCFKITVESWDRTPGARRPYRLSELSLIDLAGSERYSAQRTHRRAEGGNINKSLLSLGKVIYALSERQARVPGSAGPGHIPYRDSKLTRILQNSLSGQARIAVVCTLNPSPAMVEESLGTLNFARRIKHVAVRAEVNEFEGEVAGTAAPSSPVLLVRYREEMGALRAQVDKLQGHHGDASTPQPTLHAVQARLDELGALILQGGAPTPQSEAWHPVSPAKQRGFTLDDPLPRVQEKLHAALSKISRLERKLAARLSLPGDAQTRDEGKDMLIRDLMQQVRELETVCEAQVGAAPQPMREEVEAEWAELVAAAQAETQARDAFIAELHAECTRLRRANEALTRLAHEQTAHMVQQLSVKEREVPAARPVLSLFAPQLRPATVLGTHAPPATDLSIDDSSSERLSTSDVDELLEEADSS
ncbi:hypothetical protein MEQU1_003041 [Malassezia equina]|uniref:Kinesin-like protein n=1 Tax=Malassezia equina TaxID=1381935 RepID=A0AAF0EDD4_9BASI|nr:hypothetical protein MEQU1_003041 [Malassezia equina]